MTDTLSDCCHITYTLMLLGGPFQMTVHRDQYVTEERLRLTFGGAEKPEVPTTYCFDCGQMVPIADTWTKKSDPNYALCETCFRQAEAAGRAKIGECKREEQKRKEQVG